MLQAFYLQILKLFYHPGSTDSQTFLSSRKHKKGLEEDVTKKRTRRAQKFQRAVVGATLQARDLFLFNILPKLQILLFSTIIVQDIMAKRNQKPEVRKAQREQAVRAAKDQKKATVKKPAVKVSESTE